MTRFNLTRNVGVQGNSREAGYILMGDEDEIKTEKGKERWDGVTPGSERWAGKCQQKNTDPANLTKSARSYVMTSEFVDGLTND